MKKYSFLLLVALAAVACTGNRDSEKPVDKAARLELEVAEKDSLLNEVFSSLNQISGNLNAIKDREGIVTTNISPEISKEQRTQITEDIAVIDMLLEQNRLELQRLQGTTEQLRRANVKLKELESLIANYTKQIQSKDKDIAELRAELTAVHFRLDELNTEVESLTTGVAGLNREKQSLTEILSTQDKALNAVYYIVGSEKSLLEAGIIKKSGFIGRTLKVNDKSDLEKFTAVDRRGLDRIIVGQRRSTVVSSHPAGSYQLITGENNLLEEIVITDPERFWETSRILVVSYK